MDASSRLHSFHPSVPESRTDRQRFGVVYTDPPWFQKGGAIAFVGAGHWIRRKYQRIRFMAGIMGGYGLMTMAYLLWPYLSFLRFNTLPSGFLLATYWFGAFLILRKTVPDVKDMLVLAEESSE